MPATVDKKVLDEIIKGFEELAIAAGLTEKKFEELVYTENKCATSVINLKKAIGELLTGETKQITLETQLSKAKEKLNQAYKNLSESVRVNNKITKEAAKEYSTALAGVAEYNKKISDLSKIEKEMAKAVEFSTKSFKDKTQTVLNSVTNISGSITKFTSTMGGMATAFGGAALTLKNATDAMLKYNNSLFTLSKTQQIFGQETDKSWNDIYEAIKGTTIYSKDELISLQNTFNSSIRGMKPSTLEFVNMQSQIVKAFGNNKEAAASAIKDIAGMQSKLPQMFNMMKEGLKLAESGGNNKRLNEIKSNIVLMGDAYGVADDQIANMIQSLSKVDGKQKTLSDPAKEGADAAKSMQNVVVDAGMAIQNEFIFAANKVKLFNENVVDGTVQLKTLMGIEFGASIASGVASSISALTSLAAMYTTLSIAQTAGATKSITAIETTSLAASGGITRAGIAAQLAVFPIAAPLIAAAAAIGSIAWAYNRIKKDNTDKISVDDINADILESDKNEKNPETKKMQEKLNNMRSIKALNNQEKQDKENIAKNNKDITKTTEEQDVALAAGTNSILAQNSALKNLQIANKINLDYVDKMSSAWKGQINTLKDLGMLSKSALLQNVEMTNIALNKANIQVEDTKNSILDMVKTLSTEKGGGIKVEIDFNNIEKTIEVLDKLKNNDSENQTLFLTLELLKKLQDVEIARTKATKANIEARISSASEEKNMQIEYLQLQKDYVDTQQEATKAAAIGASSSISLMQIQVNLLVRMQQLEKLKLQDYGKDLALIDETGKASDKYNKNEMAMLMKITDQQTLFNTAKNMLIKKDKNNDKLDWKEKMQNLWAYAKEYQKTQKYIASKGLEILNITKKTREGYLSAIEAMSIGFGEFSEIIPTQTMGIYQEQKRINSLKGNNLGNTMFGGGEVSKKALSWSHRQSEAGGYGPMMWIEGQESREAKIKDIGGVKISEQDILSGNLSKNALTVPTSAAESATGTKELSAKEAAAQGSRSNINGTAVKSVNDIPSINATFTGDNAGKIISSATNLAKTVAAGASSNSNAVENNTTTIENSSNIVQNLITSLNTLNSTIKGLKISNIGASISGIGNISSTTTGEIKPTESQTNNINKGVGDFIKLPSFGQDFGTLNKPVGPLKLIARANKLNMIKKEATELFNSRYLDTELGGATKKTIDMLSNPNYINRDVENNKKESQTNNINKGVGDFIKLPSFGQDFGTLNEQVGPLNNIKQTKQQEKQINKIGNNKNSLMTSELAKTEATMATIRMNAISNEEKGNIKERKNTYEKNHPYLTEYKKYSQSHPEQAIQEKYNERILNSGHWENKNTEKTPMQKIREKSISIDPLEFINNKNNFKIPEISTHQMRDFSFNESNKNSDKLEKIEVTVRVDDTGAVKGFVKETDRISAAFNGSLV